MPAKQLRVPIHGPVQSLAKSAPVMTKATPGSRFAAIHLNAQNSGMGVGAAEEGGVQHARQGDIVGVTPAPGQCGFGSRAAAPYGPPSHRALRGRRSRRLRHACLPPSARLSIVAGWRRRWPDSRCSGKNCRQDGCGSPRAFCAHQRALARPPPSACQVYKSRIAARCVRRKPPADRQSRPVASRPSMVTTSAAVGLHRQHQATAHQHAVNPYRASPADCRARSQGVCP